MIISSQVRIFTLFACLLYSATADAASFSLPSNGKFILHTSKGKALLKQCSRATPKKVSGYWQPSATQISKLETLLPQFLQKAAKTGIHAPDKLAFHRQYVGIVVGNKRLIYGNFYNMEASDMNQASEPIVVCDGGAAFWGIVFSPEDGAFSDLRVNGYI